MSRLKLEIPGSRTRPFEDILEIRPIPFAPPPGSKIVHFYPITVSVGELQVTYVIYILEDKGRGLYFIREPNLEPGILAKLSRVINEIASYGTRDTTSLSNPVNVVLKRFDQLDHGSKASLAYFAARTTMGYGPLDPVLRDPDVEDISCEGARKPLKVWHRRFNQFEWLETNITFDSQDGLDALVAKMAFRAGRPISTSTPLLDATLPEGHRVSASWQSEVSPNGSSFTIRKFRERAYTITELMALGTLGAELAAYLWTVMEMKGFTIIAGVTASGKTTLLNAIATLLNPNYKIVSIEDVREMQLPHTGWKPLLTRPLTLDSPYNIDMELLTRFALRERPDYIILGEGRGAEMTTLFQSAATGHGVTTTFHAPNPEGLSARLTGPPISLDRSTLNSVDCVAFISKMREDAKLIRRVTSVGDFKMGDWKLIHIWDGNWWTSTDYIHKSIADKADTHRLSQKHLEESLDRKMRFLSELQKRKIYAYEELALELRKFYTSLLDQR